MLMKSVTLRLVALTTAAAVTSHAHAQPCYSGSQAINPATVSAEEMAIRTDGLGWLSAQRGGLASAVRDLAASDPDFAITIVAATTTAKQEQTAAVGAGLGQAVGACQQLPKEATKIQAAVAASKDPTLLASYSSATGDTQTASVGGGGGGGGGSGVGGPTGGLGGAGGFSASGEEVDPTRASPSTFRNLLTGGAAASSSFSTTISTISAGTYLATGATSVSAF